MVAIGAIFGAFEFIELFRTANNVLIIGASKVLASACLGMFIPYQMLTIESKYSDAMFAIIAAVIAFFILYSYF